MSLTDPRCSLATRGNPGYISGFGCHTAKRAPTMPVNVNLDALISREDFEVKTNKDDAPTPISIAVRSLEHRDFFYQALRKPDFQRETGEWSPARVAGLIRTFVGGELIPAVILWRNRELLFVIDGSHRLSALAAWVQDDYGDGELSRAFFNNMIPEEQIRVAKRTRELVEKELGSYQQHVQAAANPEGFGPDVVQRARRLGSLALSLQWVSGSPDKAEKAFIRINQQAAMLSAQELELLESRKKPNAISARAIIRRGTGHKYWSSFSEEIRQQIEDLATELYTLLFTPPSKYPIKSVDLPAGGPVYSSTALRMTYDFINLSTGAPSPDDDEDGQRTVDCLKRCRRVMYLLLSNQPMSLGLHPAVYFYSWTGKQQPILFLVMAQLLVDYERGNRLPEFIKSRQRFESFLVLNRSLVNQIVRKFGTKKSGMSQLRGFYDEILRMIREAKEDGEIIAELTSSYTYLQPTESPYEGTPGGRMSSSVKSGLVIRDFLESAPRCAVCTGYIPTQSISVDHRERREDGGKSGIDNAQLTHPYCNTGYREAMHAAEKKRPAKT
jgi:Protein of unknown function DUF262/HNH endonuclease